MSKGSEELLKLVREIFPHQRIELEHNIAERGALFLDIYLPRLKVAFEYDGKQHFEYCEHFHGTREAFLQARRRDENKDDRCEELGITLIRVAYDEEMTKELLLAKLEKEWNG